MARRGKDQADPGGAPRPDEGWGTHVPGTRPIAGASPAGAPGVMAGPPPESQPGRGRPWLILLVSFAVQLVVVVAAGNTAVVRNAFDYRNDHNTLLGAFASLPSVYSWRLTPLGQDTANAYPASLFGLLALVVVAALLTLALVRGPITFWRAFVAVLLSVLAGTLVNGIVRRGVLDVGSDYRAAGGKTAFVLFQGGGSEVIAGLVTGALAGLVAAIVAVVSRRPAEAVVPLAAPEPAPYVEPPAPPPWHGDDVRPPSLDPAVPAGPPPSFRKPEADDTQATTQFAAVPTPSTATEDASGATTRLRREDLGQYGPPTVVRREEEPAAEPAERQPDPSEVEPAEAPEAAEPPVDQRTTEFRAQRPQQPAAGGSPQQPAAGGMEQPQATQAMPSFPRPPDDEDLGHQPDDD